MSAPEVTIFSEWLDGREALHIESSNGWKSASLWAEGGRSVIEYWAELESSAPAFLERRTAADERARLLTELDKAKREVERVTLALAGVS